MSGVNWDKTPWNAGPGELPGDDALAEDDMAQCDCCGDWWAVEDIVFVSAPNNSGSDTYACPKCRREPILRVIGGEVIAVDVGGDFED